MVISVPKFQDGEVLSETQLYQLAWFPLNVYSLHNLATGYIGFISPQTSTESVWNNFQLENNSLIIENLFVISNEGIPFIFQGKKDIEIVDGEDTLVATVYLAKDSQPFSHEFFLPTYNSDTNTDDDNQPNYNAYQIAFQWGETPQNVIDGAISFDVTLGKIINASTANSVEMLEEEKEAEELEERLQFEHLPLIYNLDALPELQEEISRLGKALTKYINLLLDNTKAQGVDRSDLLSQLEGLSYNLSYAHMPTKKIIKEALFVLKAVLGFYARLAYYQNRKKMPYEALYKGCEDFTGRLLEHKLNEIHTTYGESPDKEVNHLNDLLESSPKTGTEQIKFFQELEFLFDEKLYKKLSEVETELPLRKDRVPIRHDLRQTNR